ncbi:response regulator [Devosia sp. 1566]|uniref:response regulator n=1 Tax=Devosia sp. 1566 TaxID=2499144 RepID=UPI000FDC723C|nr:response regulator [Devosia sp. 1566]
MSSSGKLVAVFAANDALSSLLAMVLAGDLRLRVRQFDCEAALFAYMRLAPIDVLIVDFDREGRPAYEMVEAIRLDLTILCREVPVIALTRAITPPMRHQAISAGIDEVVIKPMSPRHLLQRVQARLRAAAGTGYSPVPVYRGPERRKNLPGISPQPLHNRRASDNVVQLFPKRAQPSAPQLSPN